mgnify:CR=1 FL=1
MNAMRYLLFFLILITGVAAGQSPEARHLDELHRKKFTWLIQKNYDSLNWVLDERVKYIHSNGWIQSKKEVIEDLKSGKLNYNSVTIEFAEVSFYSSAAVITGKGMFKGLMPDGSEFNIHLLYTEVYVKLNNQWKLVSRQAVRI